MFKYAYMRQLIMGVSTHRRVETVQTCHTLHPVHTAAPVHTSLSVDPPARRLYYHRSLNLSIFILALSSLSAHHQTHHLTSSHT